MLALLTLAAIAADEPAVRIEAAGRLRHGVVSIGGETTGTTLTVGAVVWEVQLRPQDAAFADANNKRPVEITGTVRKVKGVESGPRWIIDVTDLAAADAKTFKERAKVRIAGTLSAGGRACDGVSDLAVEADGQTWPIAFPDGPDRKAAAEQRVGQPVTVTGTLFETAQENQCSPATVRVEKLTPRD